MVFRAWDRAGVGAGCDKGQHKDPCEETLLYLDCCGGHTILQM